MTFAEEFRSRNFSKRSCHSRQHIVADMHVCRYLRSMVSPHCFTPSSGPIHRNEHSSFQHAGGQETVATWRHQQQLHLILESQDDIESGGDDALTQLPGLEYCASSCALRSESPISSAPTWLSLHSALFVCMSTLCPSCPLDGS